MIVHVMAHHNCINECKEAISALEKNNISYNVRRIRWTEGSSDVFDDNKYSPEDLAWLMSKTSTVKPNTFIHVSDERKMIVLHSNDIIKQQLNQFKGWSCNAGLESLMINHDGEVYRATCRVGNSLGNIYSGSFNIPTESIICDRNYCTCAADIPLTKIK
jgi:MoaA/NifB/PqqE/SkfB family radical SAM enzyme